MNEDTFVEEFNKSISTYFSDRLDYTSVHALLVSWQQNDLDLTNELLDLRKLFEDDFNFAVTSFPIPSNRAQQRLNLEISSFVTKWSTEPDTLIIIYYAGHCYKSEQGEARWSAFEAGEPTLSWSACQQNLFGALGDVLLVLDCCEAAVIAKGTKAQGRFEILAASAKGVTTPEPGKLSFTSFFIRELKQRKDECVTVKDLAAFLAANEHIQQTPVPISLGRNNPTSISLQPLRSLKKSESTEKPSSFAIIQASLTQDSTGSEIANWLKIAPPKSVTAVSIEAVVLQARNLQRQTDVTAFPPGSIFRRLSEQAQRDIVQQLRGLDNVITQSAAAASNPSAQFDDEEIVTAFDGIQTAVSNVQTAVETPLLLDLAPEDLDEFLASGDNLAGVACEAITLRQLLLATAEIPRGLEIPRGKVTFTMAQDSPRFQTGHIQGKQVLAEVYPYDEDVKTSWASPEDIRRLEQMIALLCQPKRPSFHILPCVGYMHDKVQRQFSIVFEISAKYNGNCAPQLLQKLYSSKPFMPLGDRIKIAYLLTNAIENFHRVDWVHKELRSDNVVFLSTSHSPLPCVENQSNELSADCYDLTAPWLFGFQYARATNAHSYLEDDYTIESNLYRHPDRWGRPLLKFQKSHDIHSLGILLFEIGNWKSIESFIQRKKRINGALVLKQIEAWCKKKMSFQIGEVFTAIILACLHFNELTQGLNEYEMQRYFQQSIMTPLQRMVDRI